MTREQKIEEIRNACIKANPSILDLVFGCELKAKNLLNYRRFYAGRNEEEGERYYAEIDQVGCEDKQWYSDGVLPEKQIIGREIRLADCLYAIWKANPANRTNFIVESSGTMIHRTAGTNPKIAAEWNLLKDSLSDQSEKTIDFIHNLLK